ncbi:hypothetical protein MtrunA17_Chr3g0141041 [Medicago truncatula]|uniref:Uncharacterized protein n=1 Tax=Medicago truncatula TaxID=3880 RepID=A0A396J2K4_MEDTR|nr:hypothetical protein MtrunA17_Chr3g0141041 [Medicago truncatula]
MPSSSAGQNWAVRPNPPGTICLRVDRSVQTDNSVQAGKQTWSSLVWFSRLQVGDPNLAKPVSDRPNIYLLYNYFTIYKILIIKSVSNGVVLCLCKYFSSHHKFSVTINNRSSRRSQTCHLFLVFSDLRRLKTLFAPATSLLINFSLQEQQEQLKILLIWKISSKTKMEGRH